MALLNAPPAPAALTRPALVPLAGAGMGAPAAASGSPGFGRVWSDVNQSGSRVEVQAGDTLIGLVKAHYRQQGTEVSETQAFRLAHQVAADNGISNPDLILPGQKVDFARLQLPPLARNGAAGASAFTSAEDALSARAWRTASPVPATLQSGDLASNDGSEHPPTGKSSSVIPVGSFLGPSHKWTWLD